MGSDFIERIRSNTLEDRFAAEAEAKVLSAIEAVSPRLDPWIELRSGALCGCDFERLGLVWFLPKRHTPVSNLREQLERSVKQASLGPRHSELELYRPQKFDRIFRLVGSWPDEAILHLFLYPSAENKNRFQFERDSLNATVAAAERLSKLQVKYESFQEVADGIVIAADARRQRLESMRRKPRSDECSLVLVTKEGEKWHNPDDSGAPACATTFTDLDGAALVSLRFAVEFYRRSPCYNCGSIATSRKRPDERTAWCSRCLREISVPDAALVMPYSDFDHLSHAPNVLRRPESDGLMVLCNDCVRKYFIQRRV